MNKLKKAGLLSALIFTAFALFTKCSKDRIEPEPDPQLNSYSSPDAFTNKYKQEEQEFIITSDSGGPIVGNQGTKLWGGRTIFMHQNGNDVDLPYSIKLVELYSIKDMLLYYMPTVSANKLLTTDGEIRVRAFKGTEELLLKPGYSYAASMPSAAPSTAMQLFYGKNSGAIVDWTNDISSLTSTPGPDNIIANADSARYDLSVPHLGWLNLDFLSSNSGSKTKVKFTSTKDDLTNVVKFLYFKDLNSLVQVYTSESIEVPTGSNFTAICFAVGGNGKLFYYKETSSISSGHTLTVTLTETTEADLIGVLNNL